VPKEKKGALAEKSDGILDAVRNLVDPGSKVTVGPKTGGGWQVSGEDKTYKTQREGEQAARKRLTSSGGGELVVKGRDGRVRMHNTIGRPDPRRSKG
jgi:hypothetical protein